MRCSIADYRWGSLTPMFLLLTCSLDARADVKSHPPMRPLPVASSRPEADGPSRFVDAVRGNDQSSGSRIQPWKTLQHAVNQLSPGQTLYVRGGTYYEHVTVSARGSADRPITIRSVPGELAIIDGGLPEFSRTPETAWEPYPDGAPDEYRSTRTYSDLGGGTGQTNVLGLFADSMIPLHGYRHQADLRTTNEYFSNLNEGKTESGSGVYCGPGVFYDVQTSRIHVRLAHTYQKALGNNNYRGETDPRKLPLVVAGLNAGPALDVANARYVRIQDLVVRGARTWTVSVTDSANIEFDGVTAYGGSAAMGVRDSVGLRLLHCALRGIAAPWTYRGSLKYRAIEARIFSASGWNPTGSPSHDFELAYSEFTDCVDGVFVGNVRNVQFHHNVLDNISDDGMFLTSTTAFDGATPGGNVHVYQNLLSRCLTTFAFGVGHGRQKMTDRGRQTGAGVLIYRNVFDFRRPVMYTQPGPDQSELTSFGRIAGDHGSPLWEPMTVYHNTILASDAPFRSYYLAGLGGHLGGGSRRHLFNNIVVHTSGRPGNVLPPVVSPQLHRKPVTESTSSQPVDPLANLLDGKPLEKKKEKRPEKVGRPDLSELGPGIVEGAKTQHPLPIDFQADANLHWSYSESVTSDAMFRRFRDSPEFESSKTLYEAGWTAHDLVADPRFFGFRADWSAPVDLRLHPDSPARDAGVTVRQELADPLRPQDTGPPDVGAIPAGSKPWRVGVQGRLNIFRQPVDSATDDLPAPGHFLVAADQLAEDRIDSGKPVAILQGYPAFDSPMIQFVLSENQIPFEMIERAWLSAADYRNYRAVIVVGNLARAKVEPNRYSAEDLRHVEKYLKQGGRLVLMRGNTALFGTPKGRDFLLELTGTSRATRDHALQMLHPDHPWLKHLDPASPPAWINGRQMNPIRVSRGQPILGHQAGIASLFSTECGRGQLIYFGWDVSASMPHGRSTSTVEQELEYEQQFRVLASMLRSIGASSQ